MAATLTALKTAPGSVNAMVLLGNGTVMAQLNNGAGWALLTPSSTGSYVNGTWTRLSTAHDTRLYYSTQVLENGSVYVAGGEYGTGGAKGEVYNPSTNTWTPIPTGVGSYVDADSEILNDGDVLEAPVSPAASGYTYLYHPSTNTWSTGAKLYRGSDADEQNWVKLADGSILAPDGAYTSERYIPATNTWVNDATSTIKFNDSLGEFGTGALLPNGKAFYVGAGSTTEIYTPSGTSSPGSWAAGPTLPAGIGQDDAPAAVLPDGNVLFAVGPIDSYSGPTTFDLYNYLTNTITAATPVPTVTGPAYTNRFLDLPDGSTLISSTSSTVYDYSDGGAALTAPTPTITSIVHDSDGSYLLTGTQLNGNSEGAYYGDDAQMNSNYPIVRLTGSTGTVYFATSYNWSSTGVQTGTAPVTTNFTLPSGLPAGTYTLNVMVNGFVSANATLTTPAVAGDAAPTVATAAAAAPSTVTGLTTNLSVLGADADGGGESNLTYTWANTSAPSGGSTASVSANGTNAAKNVTATFQQAGTYAFKVTIADSSGLSVTSSVTVVVGQTLTSVGIAPSPTELTAGQTLQLTATAYDQFGIAMSTQPTFTWALASGGGTVSATGLYTSPAAGTLAQVTATTGSLVATAPVYVVSAPWTSIDLGGPTLAGSAYDSAAAYPTDTFTLTGAGNDVSGAYDQTHFVYQPLGGDGAIVARVASQGTGGSTSAKAGVMIRATTDDAAAEVSMVLTPSKGPMLVYRSTSGGSTTDVTGSTAIKAPYYVRLTRVGNVFTGAVSSDGTTWTTVGSVTVVMSGTVDVGLIQGSATATVLTTATFDHVGLFGAVADRLTVATGATSGSLNVLANDASIGGDTLTVTGVTQGGRGTVTFTSAGIVTYTASSPAFGADTFTYTMTDGLGDVSSATVTVVAQGLQAYYQMNEGTGTTTADATGDGYTATVAGATWAAGVDGSNGLAFSGTSEYATAPALGLSSSTVTLSGWIDRTGAEATSAGLIFNRDSSGGYGLDFYNTTTLGYTWGSSSSPYNFNTGLVPALNTWTFVALVVTSTNATIYMEPLGGTLSSKTQTISLPAGPFTSVTGIGEDPGYTSRYFVGSMDEVRIYDAALSAANIASIATIKPTVATAAAASPSPVTGTTTGLTALGSDYAGEAGLTYTWAATTVPTGATAPTLSINGTNAAKSTTATFSKAGSYTFAVTIADGAALSVTSAVTIVVNQTPTAILVSPATVSLAGGATQQFVATANDQFGNSLAPQPTVTWSVDIGGTGTITSTGLYTAAAAGGGTDTVRATVGTVSGTAVVTVSPGAINGTSGNDVIRFVRSGANLLVYVNNAAAPLYTLAYASLGALAVNTGAGTDTVNVDFSGGATPVPAGGLTVTGGGGADTLIVTGTTGADAATVTGTTVTMNGSSVTYANVAAIVMDGDGGADALTQSAQPGGTATLAFNGATTGGPSAADTLTVNAGTYTFAAPAAGAGAAAISLSALTVASGATVAVKTAAATTDRWAVVVSSLSLTGGRLDLGGNDLVVHNGSASALFTLLQSGCAKGAWSGVGIDSSTAAGDATYVSALGYAVNADATGKAIYATFDGQPVVATDVLVRSTVYGDANLDGVVNVADYTRVDAGFLANGTLTGWANGDFNYDGTVDGSDYTLIDNAFDHQLPAATATAAAVATPARATRAATRARATAAAALPLAAAAALPLAAATASPSAFPAPAPQPIAPSMAADVLDQLRRHPRRPMPSDTVTPPR